MGVLPEFLPWQALVENNDGFVQDRHGTAFFNGQTKLIGLSTLPTLLIIPSTTPHSSTMLKISSTGNTGTCMREKAVEFVPTRNGIRIVGVSVGQMREPDKKPLYLKFKLNGVQFSKLPPINAGAIPERRKWSFILNLQEGSELGIKLLRKRRLCADERLAQLTISFDKVQSFLDCTTQDQSIIEYQIHDSPEIRLNLNLGTIASQTRMDVVVQKSKEMSSILERLGKWQGPLATLLETSTAISEVHPIAKAVLATFNFAYRKLEAQDKCNEQVRDLAESMANVCRCICDVEQFARLPQLKAAMEDAHHLMERIENTISRWAAQGTVDFFQGDAVRLEIEKLIKDYNTFQRQFDRGIAINSAANINLVIKLQHDERLLEQLRSKGSEATRPATKCMEGTRETILSGVDSYLDNFKEPNILWIRGHPGVGKSALASTIASRLHARRRLGSYFVFERAKADITTPSALWCRVGYDLAEQWPSARRCIVGQLEAKEVHLDTPDTEDLFEYIVERALKEPVDIPPGRLPVIIIDGLDECGGLEGRRSAGRRELLKTLKRWPRLSTKFKLIITSRPEEDIAQVLSPISLPIDLFSGTAVTSETSEDIHTFFVRRFREIAECYPESLARDWPGSDVTDRLTTRAAGLFIWAKTVVDFVDEGVPTKRLRDITDRTPRLGDMGHLYSLILNTHFPSPTPDELHWFQVLVGAVIIAKRPLSRSECVHLLEIERPTLDFICNSLRSVLDPGDTLRFTHQSFVDFLLNPEGCPNDFFINFPGEQHYLVDACLRTMSVKLRFNICNLTTSTRLNADVPDIKEKVEEGVPSYLSYSCFFWADHLSSTPFDKALAGRVKKIVKEKLLYWLEVMSLLNEMNQVAPILEMVRKWAKPANDDGFRGFMKDALHFVLDFKDPIAQSTPHIYLSALPFAPQHCQFTRYFLDSYPRIITVTTGKPTYWPSNLFVSYHQKRGVFAIVFPRDSPRYFASSSDSIFVCDAENGNIISGPLQTHRSIITSIAFHPDGHRLVSGTWDGELEVWDVKSGDQLLRLHGFEGIHCVAYSNDGQMIAARSQDDIIRIWDADSGKGIGNPIKSQGPGCLPVIVFSTDDQYLISFDGSVEIWDIHSGKCDKQFPLRLPLSANAFSPDGRFIAGGSSNGIVRIWDVKTGDLAINPLEGHTGEITSLAYSPDGKRLASMSRNEAVRVWDPLKGQMVFGPLSVHSLQASRVALSTDGTKLALGSVDGAVRMWDLDDVGLSSLSGLADISDIRNRGERVSSLQAEKGEPSFPALPEKVVGIVFSPCGKKLASTSRDGIRVWDANMGELLLGPINVGLVPAVVFSPDGKWIASLSDNGSICIWDVMGKLVRQSSALSGDSEWNWLAFLPNSKSLVSCASNRVCIWDVETMNIFHDSFTRPIALPAYGTKVIQINSEGQIQMWSTEAQKSITAHFPDLNWSPDHVVFSQSGRLVCFSQLKMFKVWDVETGKEVATESFSGRTPLRLVFSSDDRFIAIKFHGGVIGVFDVVHSRICGTWEGYTHYATDIAFSPDGRKLASGSEGGTIRIWDTSHFANSSPDHSPQEPHNPYTDGCRLEGGWVKTADGELLFWVPPLNRNGLWRPRNTAVIAKVPTKLDLTKFEYGDNWQKCRDSR